MYQIVFILVVLLHVPHLVLHFIIELSLFKGKQIFELWNTKIKIEKQKQNIINNILMINHYFTVYRHVHFD